MTAVAIGLFILAGLIATVRLLLGPNLADRIVALDVSLISFMGVIVGGVVLSVFLPILDVVGKLSGN